VLVIIITISTVTDRQDIQTVLVVHTVLVDHQDSQVEDKLQAGQVVDSPVDHQEVDNQADHQVVDSLVDHQEVGNQADH